MGVIDITKPLVRRDGTAVDWGPYPYSYDRIVYGFTRHSDPDFVVVWDDGKATQTPEDHDDDLIQAPEYEYPHGALYWMAIPLPPGY